MTHPSPDLQDTHWAYLLDTLEPEIRDALEDTLLADEASYEQLLANETGLIDAYVEGTLTTALKQHFERRLTEVPSWPARVTFAQTLRRAADAAPAVSSPGLFERLQGWLTGPGGFSRMVAIVAVAIVAIVGVQQLTGSGDGRIGALTLAPAVRGDQTVPSIGRADIDALSLTVRVDPHEPGATFDVAIWRGDTVVHTVAAVPRVKNALTITVAAETLKRGQHTARVSRGGPPLAYYEFLIR